MAEVELVRSVLGVVTSFDPLTEPLASVIRLDCIAVGDDEPITSVLSDTPWLVTELVVAAVWTCLSVSGVVLPTDGWVVIATVDFTSADSVVTDSTGSICLSVVPNCV